MRHIKEVDFLNMKKKDYPLVSIIVITYNSSKYVIETLNSAKNQTYKNIELIISDDCSTDETVEICKKWIENNKNIFVRTKLVTIDKNSGIPANCNRGIKEAKGDWVRFIAGDDALFKDAVENAISYILLNNKIKILTSSKAIYKDTFDDDNLMKIVHEIKTKNERGENFYDLPAKEQYQSLLYSNKVNPTGLLVSKELLMKIDGFDERLKFLEDYPFFLKITKAGVKIFCMDKVTVKYRKHDSSVQTIKSNEKIIFNKQYEVIRNFRKLYIYPNISFLNKIIFEYEYYRHHVLNVLKLNKNTFLGRNLYLLTSITSPLKIKRYFYKKSSQE